MLLISLLIVPLIGIFIISTISINEYSVYSSDKLSSHTITGNEIFSINDKGAPSINGNAVEKKIKKCHTFLLRDKTYVTRGAFSCSD